MDYLGGEIVIGVREFDFQEVESNPETNAVTRWLCFSYRSDNRLDLQDTMDDVVELVEEYSFGVVNADPVDVGAEDDAMVFNLDALGDLGLCLLARVRSARWLHDTGVHRRCAGNYRGCAEWRRRQSHIRR